MSDPLQEKEDVVKAPTPVGDNIARLKEFDEPTIRMLLSVLADKASAAMEPPPGLQPEDLFMSLDPAVRRWLHALGNEENEVVRKWLLKLNEEKVLLFEEMIKDYKSAKSLGRTLYIVGGAIGTMVAAVYGMAKAAPDVLDWVKRMLFR